MAITFYETIVQTFWLDEILELSQVSDTKQTSILFERNSVFSADGASGLTNDRAFITKHLGTALLVVVKLSLISQSFLFWRLNAMNLVETNRILPQQANTTISIHECIS